jgi:hypothetical protein
MMLSCENRGRGANRSKWGFLGTVARVLQACGRKLSHSSRQIGPIPQQRWASPARRDRSHGKPSLAESLNTVLDLLQFLGTGWRFSSAVG